MYPKIIASILIVCSLLLTNTNASASILDDLKNGFGSNKDRIKNSIKEVNRQAQDEINQSENESKKICKIQKKYATNHFENRQLTRNKQIQEKTNNITKIKDLLSTNKQDISNLNLTIDNLTKLLKQKTELLGLRVKEASTIDCSNGQRNDDIKSKLQQANQNLNQVDQEIHDQTREFSQQVQRLVIKMNETKPQEDKK